MADELRPVHDTRKKLDAVSPSFCLAKWKQVTIHLQTGQTHSCHHPPTHKIRPDEIAADPAALHNTNFKMYQRKLMLEGKRPSECDYCWNIEDSPGNHLSDRHFKSHDNWARPHFDDVIASPWDARVFPTYVEVSFSNTCNFKCAYCSPSDSSSWMEEVRSQGPYRLSSDFNGIEGMTRANILPIPASEPNPYLDAFWKWWPELYPQLEVFRITGGEPLLAPSTFRVLEFITKNPNPKLSLAINSNFGGPKPLITKFIEALKPICEGQLVREVALYTSVDTWGEQAEYIRHGMKFDYFWENVKEALQAMPRLSVVFMSTFNALSVPRYRQLLEAIIALRADDGDRVPRIFLDLPYLRNPGHLSVSVLTPDYKERVGELVAFMESVNARFTDKEREGMKRIHAWMGSSNDPSRLAVARKDFHGFITEYDRRRGTSFLKTFPEMREFWEFCRDLKVDE